jgi:hypothetical protein
MGDFRSITRAVKEGFQAGLHAQKPWETADVGLPPSSRAFKD